EEALRKDPEMRPLVAQIADLNSQIVRYAALYKDNPARGKQVIEEKGLQSQIDSLYALGRRQYEKKLRALGGVADSPRPAANGADEVRARISSSEATEAALQKEVDRLEGELRGLASRSAEIEALKQDLQAREDLSRGVAAALEKARLELSAPPRASRLDEAAVPVLRQERRLTFAGPAGLGGFALALFGVAVLECRRRKVHTGADLAQGLGLPVAGVLPLLPPSLNPLDPAHTTPRRGVPWHGLPNDSVDGIRALLTQAAPPRAVAVVGAAGGEGASVLAVQLAAGLARAGRRTLLLDANLRRPALHRAFGLVAKPGLADVLRGEAALPAVVRAAPADRLWVLPAGAADLRALLALSRDGVQTVLDQLKKDYDHVVIDATPVAACADALPLAQRTDAVLVSALAGVSELPAVYDAWQRLSALGARLLGVVVQGAADGAAARRPYAMPPSAS
ncbi:MAG TPA: AAA family ATPase, partial [Gemmataceae bacterium]|nr:AAA family ATPase [Gemmataceae bacterium]